MNDWIVPDWPAPGSVGAICTTRRGGVSKGPWQSLNLGVNSGDDPDDVLRNRALLSESLPAAPHWLHQVHGRRVVEHPGAPLSVDSTMVSANAHWNRASVAARSIESASIEADAQFTREKHAVCAVLAADCLPVLFCDSRGTVVAAAHAGWRGMAAGVLENTALTMGQPASELMAWMGPAIGPAVYQVGDEVKAAFASQQAAGADAFRPDGDRWLFDLNAMARHCLQRAGVGHISGGGYCTYSDSERFFSYRRDRVTGRMASLVWLL